MLPCRRKIGSFSVLITALEASVEVPKMDVVTERLLHEERKHKKKEEGLEEKAMMTRKPWKRGSCFNCGKYGHFKFNCPELSGDRKERKRGDHKAQAARKNAEDTSDR